VGSLNDSSLLGCTSGEPMSEIRATASEAAALDDCFREITATDSISVGLEVAARALRRLTPATVHAGFQYTKQICLRALPNRR
jgi:hypothetical protein